MRIAHNWGKKLKERVSEYMTRPRMIIRARSFYSRADLKLYMRKRIALAVFVGIVDLYVWSTVIIQSIPMVEHAMASESHVIIREDSNGVGSSPATHPEESNDGTVPAVPQEEPEKSEEAGTPAMDNSPSSVEAKILKAWEGTKEGRIAVAVAKSESGLRTDAMGWNCHYINAQGKQYSKACLPQDRAKAWSVDCGVMQINHIGKTCPAHLFDPDENIKIGKEKYDNSEKRIGIGFYPWMAYRNNLHLKFL